MKVFDLAWYIPFMWNYRIFGFPLLFPVNYTFSLTMRCNSRCRTCKIWQQNFSEEMSCKEWGDVIESLGRIPIWVTLSGGEPFLFDGLERIIRKILEVNKPSLLVIPTNGLLPKRIEEVLSFSLLNGNFDTNVIVNVSLDGVGVGHDEIRGIPGNFEKAIETVGRLKFLKKQFKRLTVGVHTVLSKWNIGRVKDISDYVWNNIKPDHHIFEIAEVRQEMFNQQDSPTPSIEEYRKFLEFWQKDDVVILQRRKLRGVSKITDFFRQRYYKYLLDVIFERNKKTMPSFAGFASVQIISDGSVWNCAVYSDLMGNVKDYGYDFRKLWLNSSLVKEVQRRVKEGHSCPLANENYINFLFSPWRLLG